MAFRLLPHRWRAEHHASIVAIPTLDDQKLFGGRDQTHVCRRIMPNVLVNVNLLGFARRRKNIIDGMSIGSFTASDSTTAFQLKSRVIQCKRWWLTDRFWKCLIQIQSKSEKRPIEIGHKNTVFGVARICVCHVFNFLRL